MGPDENRVAIIDSSPRSTRTLPDRLRYRGFLSCAGAQQHQCESFPVVIEMEKVGAAALIRVSGNASPLICVCSWRGEVAVDFERYAKFGDAARDVAADECS